MPITSDIPLPDAAEAPTMHRSMREFASMFEQYRTLPVLPVASLIITDDDFPGGHEVDEDMPWWSRVYRCSWDQTPHITRQVTISGKTYYRGNLQSAGFHTCMLCETVSPTTLNVDTMGFCDKCRITKASPKSSPRMGWVVSRATPTDTSPTFGFELEMEAISGKAAYEEPQVFAEGVIRGIAGHPPIVSTTDCSLNRGCEMVSHPLSYDWIVEHNDTLATMFKELRKTFRAEDSSGDHRASFHVHVERSIFNDNHEITQLLNKDWVNYHLNFLIALSGRPASSFKRWCTGGYSYIGPRNQYATWECRAFSTNAVFSHGADPEGVYFDSSEDMIHICNWIRALAWMTHDFSRFGLSPADLIVQAGFPDSLLWVRDFEGADRASTELGSAMERKVWETLCKEYGKHMCHALVRLRPGGSIGGVGLRSTQGSFNPERLSHAMDYSPSNNGIELSQTWNDHIGSHRAWAMPQHLEIVEGVPFPGEIPSIVFTPSQAV